ncbi:related to TWF1 - twinfilin, an actin monomer sequestering protein [Cephalotrichum gorgonifer]|uniref:Related to TWF1 - twinfilin, an actin monomer sequestering protein n=1 Tax=Cephalotrichum gorgonifer TaxID=2041049 RepID=A0AAE8STW6_9PEZI|nr:related to TWF1 - twinfilin, an actin monomer sequestering protein [Cephalotrichum gorgonifer]
MQSGISASAELASQFKDLLSSDSNFGLLATITKESLTPTHTLGPSTSADFASNLDLLAPHLEPNKALYIILRRHSTAPSLVAVTYIPDAAPVRQKMLFAATRLTLVRELGSEHFRETIFATTPEELTAAGFEKHDAHTKLEAPLTEEEESLGVVKRAEAEAGQGSGRREIHLSKNLSMPVSEKALQAIGEVGNGGRVLTMLKINPETESVELVEDDASPSSIAELSRAISPTEPRFSFYRYAHTHNGAASEPVLFFFTNPSTGGTKAVKTRMLYPLMKRAVVTAAETACGVTPEKKFEVEDPSEITQESVDDELHPRVQVRQGFNRPKRPGR